MELIRERGDRERLDDAAMISKQRKAERKLEEVARKAESERRKEIERELKARESNSLMHMLRNTEYHINNIVDRGQREL